MAKLYPPYVEGTIPAFYGAVLTVPFSMNKSESIKNVSGMHLKVKTVQNSNYIISCYSNNVTMDTSYCQAVFQLKDSDVKQLKIGQHYKIQIAYINHNDQVGYYSDVAVVKYTGQPVVGFEGLQAAIANTHRYNYIGTYKNAADPSETVYSYCFNLYDKHENLIQTSGEKIHNSSTNIENNESYDLYTIEQDLTVNQIYYLEYVVTTVNKMVVSTGKVRLVQKRSVDPEINADLLTELNAENGYITLKLAGHKIDDVEQVVSGTFKILRASDEDNYSVWHEVVKFVLQSQIPSSWSWNDFTIKQGLTYKYALQQYNNTGLSSNRLESDYIFSDFEHAFLYDGKRQLKIKYNPQVSSFKDTIMESKLDTLGGQYPFIFRNGNIRYKEFSIGGLISCWSDDEHLFVTDHTFRNFEDNVNLTGENIATEREFKLEVLDWLNNGEAKLFKSPAEGNYIVRLMNNSLAPNDQVGRMLHTFTSTATEIAAYSYDNLRKYGLLLDSEIEDKQLFWETINLKDIHTTDNILKYQAVALRIDGAIPGDKFWIDDGKIRKQYVYDQNGNIKVDENGMPIEEAIRLNPKTNLPMPGYEVVIGITGSYVIDLNANSTITSVAYTIGAKNPLMLYRQGMLTYAYYSKVSSRFDIVENVYSEEVPIEQFIGAHNILDELQDKKTEVKNIFYIRSFLREIQYIDKNPTEFKNMARDPLTLYYLVNDNLYGDGKTGDTSSVYDTTLTLNSVVLDIGDTGYYSLTNPEDLTKIISGNGLITEITYQKQIIDYIIENNYISYKDLALKREEVDKAYQVFTEALWSAEEDEVADKYSNYKKIYNDYIVLLIECLNAEKEVQGEVAR